MRITLGGARRAAVALTAALAAMGAAASSASAVPSPQVIGLQDLSVHGPDDTTADRVVANLSTSESLAVPSDGVVSGWTGNFTCADGACGTANLIVLRHVAGVTYTVIARSEPETVTEGISSIDTDLAVSAGDYVGVELDENTRLWRAPFLGLFTSVSTTTTAGAVGETVGLPTGSPDLPLYNFDFESKIPTTTTVTPSPQWALANTTVTYAVGVSGDGDDPITGTVSLRADDAPLAGCQNVLVSNGAATCQSPAPGAFGSHDIEASYSGDDNYKPSIGNGDFWTVEPTPVTAAVKPNPVLQRAAITYSAALGIAHYTSAGAGIAAVDFGTVAFFVDDKPVAGCQAQPVDGHDYTATCATLAPALAGAHKLKVVYSGAPYQGANSATKGFDVLGPQAKAPAAADFGSVTVGASASRTVELTNSGTAPLGVKAAAIAGQAGFAITADGCAGKTLDPGASCSVGLSFTAGSAGAHGATLTFSHAAGTSAVALTGTGVAAPAPPPAEPTPTATPEPPAQPGATIDPARKPTFAVSVPRGAGARASSVPTLSLPLACPADEECLLDGRLTVERRGARAAAAATTTVARFSKVQVRAGGLKSVKLKLSRAFVKKAQKQGVRRVRATLTINTVLGSGQRITTRQRLTLVLPKAKKAAKKQQARPRFTG